MIPGALEKKVEPGKKKVLLTATFGIHLMISGELTLGYSANPEDSDPAYARLTICLSKVLYLLVRIPEGLAGHKRPFESDRVCVFLNKKN